MEIRTVTVIGANGTMGRNISAIFASFGNATVYMVSRDIKKSEEAKQKACDSVRAESIKSKLIPADYNMLGDCMEQSQVIFESTAENWGIKKEIICTIADIAKSHMNKYKEKIFCTGTSGLSITELAELFPEGLRGNFIGMHFFNPPYTMTLCELTPTCYSKRALLENIKEYCRNTLRRTVVEVKDSPAFLGNRIGFQFINEVLQYAEKYKYDGGIDYMDAILGPFTGRAMAPLVTSNFVGLDVHKAIVDNIYENTCDYAHETFKLPGYVEKLIASGNLGRKTGAGLYKNIIHESGIKIHQVYDVETDNYRNVIKYTFPFIEKMIERLKVGDYEKAFNILESNHSAEAELCCSFLLKYVLYSLQATDLVGYDIHSADDVMATGFNWCPPLAMIQAFGGLDRFSSLCSERIEQDILSRIDLDYLFSKVEKSKYDYRKFVKAKR